MDELFGHITSLTMLLSRLIILGFFYAALRLMGLTHLHSFLVLAAVVVLFLAHVRRIAFGAMVVSFIWAAGVYLNFAPTLPAFTPMVSEGVQQAKSIILTSAKTFDPEKIAGNVTDQSGRHDKSLNLIDQFSAIDVLAKNGAINGEDADRLKLAVLRKTSARDLDHIAYPEGMK